jgi:tight adherence protein B
MQKVRVDAGMEQPLTHILLTLLVVLVAFAMTGYMLTSATLVAISAPLAVLIVFWIFVTNRIARRTATFERQLIDALDLATRSLRVGHPLVGSFQLIADEIPAPVGLVFAEVCQQQQLGMAMEEALRGAAARSGSDDLKLFVTSVVIQLRSGGNLADMMQRLANVIRERNRLARRVKVLTAQTQFSKRILLALPFLVFVLLNVINPKYMLPLYGTTTGQIIAGAALTGLFLGWITMNWISKLNP